MVREEIIKYLDKPVVNPELENGEMYLYDQLKECLRIRFTYGEQTLNLTCREIDEFSNSQLDAWFRGIIHSLYYRPNHLYLMLVGKPGIGKSEFFRRLLPDKMKDLYGSNWGLESIYYHLITDFDFGSASNKEINKWVTSIDFMVREPYTENAHAVKRLTSYCTTWNARPFNDNTRRGIILEVESINQELFNSIDKHLLWIEIFNKFKPTDK